MSIDTRVIKESVDLVALIRGKINMRKVSAQEFAGPCPRCGGEDRFHVHGALWMCRHCHPKWGDAIEYVQWANGVDFMTATQMLAGNAATAIPVHVAPLAPRKPEPPARPTWNAQDVAARLTAYQNAMPNSPASEYLIGRGFTPDTWQAYGMGYRKDYNAIAIPWFRGGALWAINYRKLDAQDKGSRFISEAGSIRNNVLYGGHVLVPNLHHLLPNGHDPLAKRSLILVEGELNAASIWQAVYPLVDVLSFGAEGNGIPETFAPIAMRYRCCVVWKDKEALAREAARQIPGAAATWSERGDKKTDANDMLQMQSLRRYIAAMLKAATPKQHAQALAYDLQDAGL